MRARATGRAVILGALLAAGCAAARPAFPPEPARGTLFHALETPDGPGPFPAVVLLHTCAGIHPHVFEWAAWFRSHGYAAAVVDSFGPRGARSVCGNWTVRVDQVAGDALTALAALRVASPRYHARGRPFAAAIAVYPLCVPPRAQWSAESVERASNLYDDVDTPTLILIGDADNDTPSVAANCADAVARLRSAGRPVDLKLYPGARHAFDQPQAYDAAATADARATAVEFFDRHLTARGARSR